MTPRRKAIAVLPRTDPYFQLDKKPMTPITTNKRLLAATAALFMAFNVATLSHAATPAQQTAGKPEVVKAQVVKVDAARGRVILKHEAINSIKMDAMTMPFKVKDASMLAPLKAGDTVDFSVALVDEEPVVTDIRAAAGPKK